MAAEWSGLAPEVLITLDRSHPVPLRAQLEDQFRQAIRSGRLSAGERVLSSRALAKALGLSRGLVQAVIIEDDYEAEFRYDRQPVGACKGSRPTR